MATLEALYLQDPYWIWLAFGCLFVALNLALGTGLLMWPGVAAVGVAAIELAGMRMGPVREALVFACLSMGLIAGVFAMSQRMATAAVVPARKTPAAQPASGQPSRPATLGGSQRTAHLVGRIGRTTGEFANGVGRVWIDGAEWGAEIDGAEEALPAGAPVRVAKVIGGIRLQVHPLRVG